MIAFFAWKLYTTIYSATIQLLKILLLAYSGRPSSEKLYFWIEKRPNQNSCILFPYTNCIDFTCTITLNAFSYCQHLRNPSWHSSASKLNWILIKPFKNFTFLERWKWGISLSLSTHYLHQTYLVLYHCTQWWCHFPQHLPHLNLASQTTTSAGINRLADTPCLHLHKIKCHESL